MSATAAKLTANSTSLIKGIAGGPVHDPFLGQAMEVNILGDQAKICSFDCRYCDLGFTAVRLNKLKSDLNLPTPQEIFKATNEAFRAIHSFGPEVQTVRVSGNGEPTLHPSFYDIMKTLVSTRDTWLPEKPIKVLTNGTGLGNRKIVDGLNLADDRIVKIDAGNEKTFKMVNTPLSRSSLAQTLAGLRKLRDVTVQALFVQGSVDNTKPQDIEDWIEVVAMIMPKAVYIQGLSRKPAAEGLIRCEEDTLYAIASRLERRTQIKAIVSP